MLGKVDTKKVKKAAPAPAFEAPQETKGDKTKAAEKKHKNGKKEATKEKVGRVAVEDTSPHLSSTLVPGPVARLRIQESTASPILR